MNDLQGLADSVQATIDRGYMLRPDHVAPLMPVLGRLLDDIPKDLIQRAHREAWGRERFAKEIRDWMIGSTTSDGHSGNVA